MYIATEGLLHTSHVYLICKCHKKEEFEETKGKIRMCKSKDRLHDGHKKNNKRKNNDLQNTTQKTKDRATRTPLKTNNDLQNTTQKTKDGETRTPLKTSNDLQNTTQKNKDRAP